MSITCIKSFTVSMETCIKCYFNYWIQINEKASLALSECERMNELSPSHFHSSPRRFLFRSFNEQSCGFKHIKASVIFLHVLDKNWLHQRENKGLFFNVNWSRKRKFSFKPAHVISLRLEMFKVSPGAPNGALTGSSTFTIRFPTNVTLFL